jgi:long-chain acyl-CoA synthetase
LICLGRKLTYGKLDELSNRLASALQNKFGVKKDDRVAVMLLNCIQHTLAFFAINKLGTIHVPCNVIYKPRELEYQLSNCGSKIFITLDRFFPVIEEIKGKTPVKNIIVTNIEDFATAEDEIPSLFKVEKKRDYRHLSAAFINRRAVG